MPEGVEFPFPSLLFYEGRTYGQPGGHFMQTCSCRRRHSSPEGRIPCRLLCTGHSYAEGVPADTIFFLGKRYLPEIKAGYGRKGETEHGDFSLYSKDCWTQQREIHHISICVSQW